MAVSAKKKLVNTEASLLESLMFLADVGADVNLHEAPMPFATQSIVRVRDLVQPVTPQAPQSQPQAVQAVNNNSVQPVVKPRRPQAIKGVEESVKAAAKLALEAESLEDLKAAMNSFDLCPLKKTATNMVFSDGNPNAKVMLIGEAPGADEDREGKPFVGRSGQLLDHVFHSIGFTRETLYISNIIPWRPPGNRVPTAQETAMCLPFIERHIELVNPELVIFIGGTSAKTLMRSNLAITKMRGRTVDYHLYGDDARVYKASALFHPAYLLRSPGQKKQVWLDLLRMKETLTKLR